jgi:hypothetical protein
MKPILSSISYRGENFTTKFTNSLSVPITIENSPLNRVTCTELISNGNCTDVLINGKSENNLVEAGGQFTISATCPHKVDGESFEVIVIMPYNATMGGITTNHTDTGHIKRQGEPL